MGANFELTDNTQVKMDAQLLTEKIREEILNQLFEKLFYS